MQALPFLSYPDDSQIKFWFRLPEEKACEGCRGLGPHWGRQSGLSFPTSPSDL